jgi:hypothetical protein
MAAEAAFSDYWGVWEPFWWLVRGGKVVEGESEVASAERVTSKELLDAAERG